MQILLIVQIKQQISTKFVKFTKIGNIIQFVDFLKSDCKVDLD